MDRSTPPATGSVDWVDLGEVSAASGSTDVIGTDPPPPRSRRTTVVAGLAVMALVGVVVSQHIGSSSDQTPAPKGASLASPSAPAPATGDLLAEAPQVGPFHITDVGSHVLGVNARWDLVGWGASQVVRLQMAAGLLTVTPLPALQSNGPVSFAVGTDRVAIRPLDDVPGYSVVDGRPATTLRGTLAGGGTMLPGPTADTVWREDDDWFPSVVLTRLDGTLAGPRATLPTGTGGQLMADGSGYVLSVSTDGVFDVRPAGIRRLTTGTLAAVGAGRVLAVECSDSNRCSAVAVSIDGRNRKVIDATFPQPAGVGTIAPDGRRAAVVVQAPDGEMNLEIVDLRTGKAMTVAMAPGSSTGTSLAWSPDSAMLFALDADGAVHFVESSTGDQATLPVTLPPLTQIAIRPAPR